MDQERGFGRLLRGHRRAAGLTLEDLAERSGVSVRAISDMERGASRGPRARTVTALADALGPAADRDVLLDTAAAARRRRYASAPEPSGPGAGPAVLDLPAGTPDFTGRSAELATLRELAEPGGPRALVVTGPGGLGKTALAVQATGQVADRFPDGRLFLNLRGVDAEPLDPGTALVRLLRALDTPEDAIPTPIDERTALYQRLIEPRRLVVVLDNAAAEAQVRPLVPAGGSSLAMITSRRGLTGLEHSRRILLGPMSDADAVRMLAAVTGGDDQDPEQQRRVARQCGHFPLALRIAGNRLSSRPDWTLATLADRLADEERRLDRLTAGDLEIRATFQMSYRQLSAPAQLLFRRLALTTGPSVSTAAAAVVADLSERRAERLLEELVELGLLTPVGYRYALHDLVRLYARDRLSEQDGVTETSAAAARLRDWLLRTAVLAAGEFEVAAGSMPDFDYSGGPAAPIHGQAAARRWLEAESAGWLDALRAAAGTGLDEQVAGAAEALFWFSFRWLSWAHWPEVFALGRDAARRSGDERLEALHLNNLALAQLFCSPQRPSEALASAMEAGRIAAGHGDVRQQAWSARYAASACVRLGRQDEALDHTEAAVRLFHRYDDLEQKLPAQLALAALLIDLGRPEEASQRLQRVLDRLDDPDAVKPVHLRSTALTNLGRAHAAMQDWPAAATHHRSAVDAAAAAGLRTQQGRYLLALADALDRTGRTGDARVAREDAHRLFVDTRNPVGADEARTALDQARPRAEPVGSA